MAPPEDRMRQAATGVVNWLHAQGVAIDAPVELVPIIGGQSNLTYLLRDAGGRCFVLRRPPTGQVLETAHSMHREWRFLTGLSGTGVPVPKPIAFCDDAAVLGAGFYVMDYVDGVILHTVDDARVLSESARAAVTADLATSLRQLHGVDVAECGLSDIGRGEDYIARQLRRWHGQWEKTRDAANLDVAAIDRGHVALASAIPDQTAVGIVHGDYRLGNVVAATSGAVRAVLDWELATLGDPRADLGWLLLSWEEPGEPRVTNPTGTAPSTLPGFGTRAELVAAYAQNASPDEVADIDYFVAFAAWRWACISAGVYARYQANAMGGQSGDLPAVLQAVVDHAEYALAVLDNASSITTPPVMTRLTP
jgi:aminoglycoside phosphotransferase (APT) family kinase protein